MLDDFLDGLALTSCLEVFFTWPGLLALWIWRTARGKRGESDGLVAVGLSLAFWATLGLVFYFFVLGAGWRDG